MEIVMNTYVNKAGKTINEELMVGPAVIQSYRLNDDGDMTRTNSNGKDYRVAIAKLPWSKQTGLVVIFEKLREDNEEAYAIGETVTIGSKKLADGTIIGQIYLPPYDKEELASDYDAEMARIKANAPSATVDA